jgi:hypothetical protein
MILRIQTGEQLDKQLPIAKQSRQVIQITVSQIEAILAFSPISDVRL